MPGAFEFELMGVNPDRCVSEGIGDTADVVRTKRRCDVGVIL